MHGGPIDDIDATSASQSLQLAEEGMLRGAWKGISRDTVLSGAAANLLHSQKGCRVTEEIAYDCAYKGGPALHH